MKPVKLFEEFLNESVTKPINEEFGVITGEFVNRAETALK
jgi:hypothetical protein